MVFALMATDYTTELQSPPRKNVISTSERNIAVTVDEACGENGLKLLEEEFANEMM